MTIVGKWGIEQSEGTTGTRQRQLEEEGKVAYVSGAWKERDISS